MVGEIQDALLLCILISARRFFTRTIQLQPNG